MVSSDPILEVEDITINKHDIFTKILWLCKTQLFHFKWFPLLPLSQHVPKQNELYLFYYILEQIPQLNIYPNSTMREFFPTMI